MSGKAERVVGKRGVREGDLVEFAADEVSEAIGAIFCIKADR